MFAARNKCVAQVALAYLLAAVCPAEAGYEEGREALRRGDPVSAAREFNEAAQNGDAKAQFAIALLSWSGAGIPRSMEQAAKWFAQSAAQGNVYAQYNIGLLHHTGHGVAKDMRLAAEWYEKAAQGDLAQAQNDLAFVLLTGMGVEANYPKALAWFRKAAERGHPFPQFNLACLYLAGGATRYQGFDEGPLFTSPGVIGSTFAKDEKEAARWLAMAAEQGHPAAQFNLGLLYEKGLGVQASPAEAARWYEKAAAAEFLYAFNNLARVYDSGAAPVPAGVNPMQLRMKSSQRGFHRPQEHPILILHAGAASTMELPMLERLSASPKEGVMFYLFRPDLVLDPELGIRLRGPARR